jgi:hypothetical protein
MFVAVWIEYGWHYVQFAFGDHADSKRAFGDSICRVLFERLSALVEQPNRALERRAVEHAIQFHDLKQLLDVVAVVFAMYTFWDTQLYPTSGIGLKYCRRSMDRIPIEQDYYDWLLAMPHALLRHLAAEPVTSRHARAITLQVTQIVLRLCGRRGICADTAQAAHTGAERAKREDADSIDPACTAGPVFAIVPRADHATRLPRVWPSVHVMSTLDANKHFGRLGRVVRVHDAPLPATASAVDGGTRGVDGGTEAGGLRQVVAGVSRGDLVRMRVRQRLADARPTHAASPPDPPRPWRYRLELAPARTARIRADAPPASNRSSLPPPSTTSAPASLPLRTARMPTP